MHNKLTINIKSVNIENFIILLKDQKADVKKHKDTSVRYDSIPRSTFTLQMRKPQLHFGVK